VMIVFGIYDGDGNIWLVEQHIISPLMFSARMEFAADNDPSLCRANLCHLL
jgi:hypothetical protein